MSSLYTLLLTFALMLVSGCSHYSDISGKVVDGVTGKPIEGAVVVAQWTKPRGIPGMQYHNLHKIIETLTDKEGTFSLSGTIGFIIDPPKMIIYKEGYIPWRNDSIFPSSNTVKDYEWNDNVTYKLDILSDTYTNGQLSDFIEYGMALGMGRKESSMFTDVSNKISDKKVNELRIQMSKDKKP